MEKLIIEAAINELISKQQNRHVPYGPDEVAATVKQCVDAGMSYLHFHAREQIFGEMRWNEPELYKEGILKMRAFGVPAELPWYPTYLTLDPFYQKHVVALVEDPEVRLQIAAIDMGSGNINDYDPRTKNFTSPDQTKPWSHNFHRQFFQLCRDLKLRPYLGVYEPGALRSIAKYLEMGWLEPPLVMKFFFSDAGPYGFPPNPRCRRNVRTHAGNGPSGRAEDLVHDVLRPLDLGSRAADDRARRSCPRRARPISSLVLARSDRRRTDQCRAGRARRRHRAQPGARAGDACRSPRCLRPACMARSCLRRCGRAFPLRRRGGVLIMAGRKLIIEAALHEFVPKSTNPHIPYGADEVAADTAACVAAGLSFLHFHARDGVTGAQLWTDPEPYREAILGDAPPGRFGRASLVPDLWRS